MMKTALWLAVTGCALAFGQRHTNTYTIGSPMRSEDVEPGWQAVESPRLELPYAYDEANGKWVLIGKVSLNHVTVGVAIRYCDQLSEASKAVCVRRRPVKKPPYCDSPVPSPPGEECLVRRHQSAVLCSRGYTLDIGSLRCVEKEK